MDAKDDTKRFPLQLLDELVREAGMESHLTDSKNPHVCTKHMEGVSLEQLEKFTDLLCLVVIKSMPTALALALVRKLGRRED